MQLHETSYGKRFFDAQLPKLINELGRIADALEKQNENVKENKTMKKIKKNKNAIDNANFYLTEKATGNIILGFDTLERAKIALEMYEYSDKIQGYEQYDFYDIVDKDKNSVIDFGV